MKWLDSVIEATNMNLTQLREAVEDRRAWRALVHGVGHDETTKQQAFMDHNLTCITLSML